MASKQNINRTVNKLDYYTHYTCLTVAGSNLKIELFLLPKRKSCATMTLNVSQIIKTLSVKFPYVLSCMGNYAKFSEDLLKLDCKTSDFVTSGAKQGIKRLMYSMQSLTLEGCSHFQCKSFYSTRKQLRNFLFQILHFLYSLFNAVLWKMI